MYRKIILFKINVLINLDKYSKWKKKYKTNFNKAV